MRFLQKPRQAGHELNPTEMSRASGKKDRNRDRKRSNNYEISGYFATKKVSRAENAGNVQKLPTKHPLGDSKRDHKIRTYRSSLGRESVHTVIPTVEARESSVVEQYDSRKSSTGETPFTWSESNPQSKGHKVFPRDFSAIHVGQLDENSPLQIHINQGRVVHNRGPSSAPTDSGSFRPSDETLPSRHGSQSHVMERGATIRLNHLQRNREPIRSGQDLKEMLVAEHHRYSAVETPIYSKNDGGRLSHQPPDVRTQSSETNSNKIRKETPERRCSPDVKRGQPDKTRDRVDPATSSSLGQLLKRCDAAFDVPGNDVDAQDTYAANYQPQNLADDDIQHSHIRYPRIYDQFDEPYDENLGAVNDYVGDDTFIFAIPHDNNTHIDYGEFDLGFNEGQYEFLGAEGGGEIDAIDIGAEGLEEGVSVLLPCQDDECEVTESAIFEERTIPEEPLMTREGLFLDERFQNFWRPNRLY
ncbi:hypothetical protein M501DRAFT_1019774 [Patellaria atrata CBS 101060]|uniref:Uncharacterized protein n=1 Tax=Patellaria atrata CBS 101060 TaxID=1346257 RepID=A0A9P4VLF6_9PEZI|nr:hypothetical protein M501DRAFT_1019774 [Patellaria atrata CBS 101060]